MKFLIVDVIVTGSISFDYIMNFPGLFADRIMPDKIHVLSLSFLVNTLKKQFGGTAVNQAYTLKLLGVEPRIKSVAGNDWEDLQKFLVSHGVSTDGIKVVQDEPCSSYHVVTDKNDNQIGAFYVGSSKYNKDIVVKEKTPPAMVMIGPTDPTAIKRYVAQCRKLGYPYLYDPAFQIDNFTAAELRQGIRGAEIFIGNDYEIELVTRKLGWTHTELAAHVPVLITTLAGRGSVIESKGKKIPVRAAKPKDVSDPTGAGDAYRAGFLAGYLRGFDLTTCGQMGSVAAVYTVEKYGTVTHVFTRRQFEKRYRENYGESLKLSSE